MRILSLFVIAFIMSSSACSDSKKTTRAVAGSPSGAGGLSEQFDIEGHRGCRGLMPENTIPAFLKALDLGVTTLEMDVIISKDSQVIISHEPFFNHEITTKPDGSFVTEAEERSLNIYQISYAETQQFDVGLKPHPRFPEQIKIAVHKPLLQDVIDAVRKYCTEKNRPLPHFNIETKCLPTTDNIYHPEPATFVELLMKVIATNKIEEQVIIQSFDYRSLQYLHKHYPTIRTAPLVEEEDAVPFTEQIKKLGFTPTIYSPAYHLVTPELVTQCKQERIKLIPWTVNDTTEMKKLKDLGVDGLITDYPNRYFEWYNNH